VRFLHEANLIRAASVVGAVRPESVDRQVIKAIIDLQDADLSGADLVGDCLSFADLSGARLSDTRLSGADLFDADLYLADLRYADLRTSPKIPLSATALMYVAALNNEFWDGFKQCQFQCFLRSCRPTRCEPDQCPQFYKSTAGAS
jgi:hypothetical protein